LKQAGALSARHDGSFAFRDNLCSKTKSMDWFSGKPLC